MRATTVVPPWTVHNHFNAFERPTTCYITDAEGNTVVSCVEQSLGRELCAWAIGEVWKQSGGWNPEEQAIAAVIGAARCVQEFLWGEKNAALELGELRRMFRKRVVKLEEVDPANPHAAVELKKQLLQAAALAVAMIGRIERDGVPPAEPSGA